MPAKDTQSATGPTMTLQRVNRWDLHGQPSLPAATALLTQAGLPTDDLDGKLEHFIGAGSRQRLDGVVGLELFSGLALLRSLAVAPAARGQGLGKVLVSAAEDHARSHGARQVFLLSETAEDFFRSLGYRTVARSFAPEQIRATREFSDLCPESASFMTREL